MDVDRRLELTNRIAATAFVIGGSLFCLGALLAQAHVGGPRLAAAVFLAGGVFFTTGGYTSVLLAANEHGSAWHWWAFEPRRLDWASAFVLFVGTLYFGISLLAALIGVLTTALEYRLVWSPVVIGCVLFLVSGHLALLQLRRQRRRGQDSGIDWWIAVVNQVGSALFLVAAIAAYVRPSTGDELAVGIANWGTFAGAACFAAAGVIQEFDRP
ncbi:MAG: hypothetical protein ACTHNY_01465 [Solirubrobacterales bacterium]